MKILYVIMHSKKFKDRVNTINKTWGKNKSLLFYGDYQDLEKNIIKVSDRDDYNSNEEKHVNIIKQIDQHILDSDWVFLCDDDTFINTKKLEDYVLSAKEDEVHGYLIKCYNKIPDLVYPSGGAGVLIHKSMISKISKKIVNRNTNFADVTLGVCLKENNITLKNMVGLHSETPSHYNLDHSEVNNNITFHHIKNELEMEKLNNFVNNE